MQNEYENDVWGNGTIQKPMKEKKVQHLKVIGTKTIEQQAELNGEYTECKRDLNNSVKESKERMMAFDAENIQNDFAETKIYYENR